MLSSSKIMTSDDFIPKRMKYSLFFLILLFWFLGAFSVAAGFYVHFDQMQPLKELMPIRFTPAFMLLVLGVVLFITAFVGYIGALRENIYFLRWFLVTLVVLFAIYVATFALASIVALSPSAVYADAEGKLRKAVITYQDDDESAEYIDKIQITMGCCGVGYEGYKDWMLNSYFSCNESNSNAEKCGVPASCCRFDSLQFGRIDTTCGYGTTNEGIFSKLRASSIIHTQGCMPKVEEVVQCAAEFLCFTAFACAALLLCGIVLSSRMLSVLKMKVREYWNESNNNNDMMYYTPDSGMNTAIGSPCQLP